MTGLTSVMSDANKVGAGELLFFGGGGGGGGSDSRGSRFSHSIQLYVMFKYNITGLFFGGANHTTPPPLLWKVEARVTHAMQDPQCVAAICNLSRCLVWPGHAQVS